MGLSFLKQLQILILSTHTGPCQAQSFLKKHLEKNADCKKKHPSDNTCSSLTRLSHPQTGPRDHSTWTTMVMSLLTNRLGKSRFPHTPRSEREPPAIGTTIYGPLGKRKGWELPYLLQKKHHLPWSLGPGWLWGYRAPNFTISQHSVSQSHLHTGRNTCQCSGKHQLSVPGSVRNHQTPRYFQQNEKR